MNMRYLYFLIYFLSSYVIAQNREVHNRGEIHIKPNTLVSVKSAFVNESSGNFINDGEVIFYSHTINDGEWDFTHGLMGYTRFEATSLQNIQGNRPIRLFDILFNNPTSTHAFELYADIDVYGEVSFFEGIVNTRTTGGVFTFYENAYSVETNDLSHIDGFVHKIGNSIFQYPIGNQGYYRPLQTYGATGVSDRYASIYHLENSNTYFPHSSKEIETLEINTTEYWELNDIVTSDHVYVSISLDDRTTGSAFMESQNQPTIVAWNSQNEQWEDLGGVLDNDGKSITTIFKTDVYGAYTLAINKQEEDEEEDVEFEIFNAVNPNDNRGNEYFRITGLDKYPDNDVTIFNRWGVEVFHTRAYDTNGNVFNGISKGRVTIQKNKELPEGTYFYVIRRTDPKSGKRLTNTGYLYLIR